MSNFYSLIESLKQRANLDFFFEDEPVEHLKSRYYMGLLNRFPLQLSFSEGIEAAKNESILQSLMSFA